MSIRSRLGMRNDQKTCPILETNKIDIKLKNSTKVGEKSGENKKNCQDVKFDAPKDKMSWFDYSHSSDQSYWERKKKRRSNLGQRSQLHNLNSILNITNNDGNLTEIGYSKQNEELQHKGQKSCSSFNNQEDNENTLKPLFRSSPNYDDKTPIRSTSLPKRNLERKNSPINPFENDVNLNFFETEINNLGNWSVFKTRKVNNPNTLKTPSTAIPEKSKTGRNGRSDENVDHLLRTSKSNRPEPPKIWSPYQTNDEDEEKELHFKHNSMRTQPISKSCVDVINSKSENVAQSSNDVIENIKKSTSNLTECEITSSLSKSEKKAEKLSIIMEEQENLFLKKCRRPLTLQLLSEDENSTETDESNSSIESNFNRDLDKLKSIYFNLENRSHNIDKILKNLIKEKESYNSQFNTLKNAINDFEELYAVNHSRCSTNVRRRKKHIVSCKLNRRFSVTPTKSNTSVKKSKAKVVNNNYSELRKSFAFLQTPQKSASKSKQNQTVCYTPNSLSNCISDQLSRLDS